MWAIWQDKSLRLMDKPKGPSLDPLDAKQWLNSPHTKAIEPPKYFYETYQWETIRGLENGREFFILSPYVRDKHGRINVFPDMVRFLFRIWLIAKFGRDRRRWRFNFQTGNITFFSKADVTMFLLTWDNRCAVEVVTPWQIQTATRHLIKCQLRYKLRKYKSSPRVNLNALRLN